VFRPRRELSVVKLAPFDAIVLRSNADLPHVMAQVKSYACRFEYSSFLFVLRMLSHLQSDDVTANFHLLFFSSAILSTLWLLQ
jgi:hypothetical protein